MASGPQASNFELEPGIIVDLSVVILNWNTRALLEDALRSIVCAPHRVGVETIVVDNGSADGSQEMVQNCFPGVTLIHNPINSGFGAGNNVALPVAAGRYILFLNSDTVVEEGALDAMVQFADAHPDIGILGPKLLNTDGSLQYSCRRYPNLGTGFFRNTPLGRLFPKNRFNIDYLLQDWDHASPRDVDWVSGAALMIRRSLLEQIGSFDEDFFMYCEDVDLCWRANHAIRETGDRESPSAQTQVPPSKALSNMANAPREKASKPPNSWRVTYFPDAVIHHHIGKSSDMVPTRMTYHFHRSQHIFYKKHYAAGTPLWLRPIIPVGIWLRAAGKLLRYRIVYFQRRARGEHRPIPSAQEQPKEQHNKADGENS